MTRWHVVSADPLCAAAESLIAAHASHADAHYPAESNHNLSGASLKSAGARFFLASDGGDAARPAQGMAAYVPVHALPGGIEVKSMFVTEAARGLGASRALLAHALDAARAEGFATAWLETGSRAGSAAARGLYARFGFEHCAPFGAYRADPESVFMRLEIR